MESNTKELVIIGAGPSALATAIYTTREDIPTVLYEKAAIGGMAAITDWIDNYPGFAGGVAGMKLSSELQGQAERFGAVIDYGEASALRRDGDSLKAPFAVDGPAEAAVIEGWQKGIVGMKIGGIRELTIPSDLAYGETGSGEDIPANTPLKFIVMAIPPVEEVEMPQVLKDYYKRQYGTEY